MSDILFELKADHFYIARNGTLVGPIQGTGKQTYPFTAFLKNQWSTWMKSGRFNEFIADHGYDLVREATAEELAQLEPTALATQPKAQPEEEATVDAPRYNQGDIECIEAIKAALTPEEFRGWLKGDIMKYVWRERHKGGARDIRKARYYLQRLLDEMEGNLDKQPGQ